MVIILWTDDNIVAFRNLRYYKQLPHFIKLLPLNAPERKYRLTCFFSALHIRMWLVFV